MSFLKYIVASQISAKDIAICFNLPIGTVREHNLVVGLSSFHIIRKKLQSFFTHCGKHLCLLIAKKEGVYIKNEFHRIV